MKQVPLQTPRPWGEAGVCGGCWISYLGHRSERSGGHLKQIYLGKQSIKGLSLSSPTEAAFIKFAQWHPNPYAPSLTWHQVNCMAKASGLSPRINSSQRSPVSIDFLLRRRLSAAALCWCAHNPIVALKNR